MTLEWTGERFIPGVGPEIAYEHYSRYLFARLLCGGKSVVDIPCGEGFGSALLAQVASSVVAFDIAPEAVAHASATYAMPNLRFAIGDMVNFNRQLDAPVDVVVCFEGIEHIAAEAQEAAIAAMANALKDDGLLIISTPNKLVYTDLARSHNQFHLHELYTDDFARLLAAHFPHRYVFGQTLADAATISPLSGVATTVERHYIEFNSGKDVLRSTIPDADRFTYLVAVCAKRELPDAAQFGGFVILDLNRNATLMQRTTVANEVRPLHALVDELRTLGAHNRQLADENRQLADENREFSAANSSLDVRVAELASENAALVSQATAHRIQHDTLLAEVEFLRFHYHRRISLAGRELANFVSKVPFAKRVAYGTALPVAKRVWYLMKGRRAAAARRRDLTLQVSNADASAIAQVAAPPPSRERTIHQMLEDFARRDPVTYVERDRWYSEEDPEVSIIILNLNKADLTIRCVKEVWKYTSGRRYEIIVVDNGSRPDDFIKLTRFQGRLRLIRLTRNRYFGEGNNIGAEAARGKYLFFLNNDAFVTPDWLAPFMRAFEQQPRVGAVGPMFVYPDGTLQEAGSLVNADGTANMLGRNGDKDDPEFNYQRDVDYCSAAGLMVRKDLFEEVLGFDLCWEPAYYEDVDLCMKVKQLGYRVLYCPEAKIVHIEHFTSLDTSHNIYFGNVVEINRHKFVARWKDQLGEKERASMASSPK